MDACGAVVSRYAGCFPVGLIGRTILKVEQVEARLGLA